MEFNFCNDLPVVVRERLRKMSDNYLIRKVSSGDAEVLAYIQTESWKAAFKNIISEDMPAAGYNKTMPWK